MRHASITMHHITGVTTRSYVQDSGAVVTKLVVTDDRNTDFEITLFSKDFLEIVEQVREPLDDLEAV